MLSAENLASIESEGRRLALAVREDPDGPVSQYPGWTLADLASHTASIHGRTVLVCREHPMERVSAPRLPDGVDPIDWYEETLEELLLELRRADPAAMVWSFGPDQNIGFWERRMVVETGVHRWDGEQAIARDEPLTNRVAEEGLDEFAGMWLPHLGDLAPLEVMALDLDRTWVYGKGDPLVRVEGSASDLHLRLMARPSPIELPDDWAAAVDSLAPPLRR
ncbi:MAG: maleylpyruvate isomerase family mycothiol-dependent enzyme [Acidimicrobiia bacterium]